MSTLEPERIAKSDSPPSEPGPHRFTVKEYYQLARAGVFDEDSRVELIEGDLIDMPPIGTRHASLVDQLTRFFVQKTSDEITVRVQNPVRLSERSEPEPDLALLQPRARPYSEAHPTPRDVLLIIEIADTSITYDRDRKIPLYSRYGVPEVWLLDIEKPALTVFLDPSEEGYRKILKPKLTAIISPTLLPEAKVDLGRFLAEHAKE